MPVYTYECRTCGPFNEFRPMTLASEPFECESCGALAKRALALPQLSMISAERKDAFITNERSAHAPKFSTKADRDHMTKDKSKHPSGCACCSSKSKKSSAVYLPDGSKTFPSKRNWMISH